MITFDILKSLNHCNFVLILTTAWQLMFHLRIQWQYNFGHLKQLIYTNIIVSIKFSANNTLTRYGYNFSRFNLHRFMTNAYP